MTIDDFDLTAEGYLLMPDRIRDRIIPVERFPNEFGYYVMHPETTIPCGERIEGKTLYEYYNKLVGLTKKDIAKLAAEPEEIADEIAEKGSKTRFIAIELFKGFCNAISLGYLPYQLDLDSFLSMTRIRFLTRLKREFIGPIVRGNLVHGKLGVGLVYPFDSPFALACLVADSDVKATIVGMNMQDTLAKRFGVGKTTLIRLNLGVPEARNPQPEEPKADEVVKLKEGELAMSMVAEIPDIDSLAVEGLTGSFIQERGAKADTDKISSPPDTAKTNAEDITDSKTIIG